MACIGTELTVAFALIYHYHDSLFSLDYAHFLHRPPLCGSNDRITSTT